MPRKPERWSSILLQGCKSDSPQRQLARLLLVQLPTLDQATFTRRLNGIRLSDPVQGSQAASWLLSSLARRMRGRERRYLQEQADLLMEEAAVMRRLRKGWSQYGVSDPWFVVHPWPEPWLPRYHSAPALR
mgnify:CR=1 FL=1